MGRTFKLVVACLAFLGALAFVAFHLHRGYRSGVGSWSAGEVRASTSEASRRVAWREPTPFATEFMSTGVPTRIAFGPRERNAVVAHGERGRDATLWFVEFDAQGGVESERPLTEIDAPGDEITPWFDGRTLWFASERAGGAGGFDLWHATLVDGQFEAVELARGSVNSAADELDPTVYDGELVFASDRDADGGFDLWSADLANGSVARLEALCTGADEREPAFAPDGGSLWFTAESDGEFAIERAFRSGPRWLSRERVAAFDGRGSEQAIVPLGSGFEVAFVREGTWLRSASVELGLVPALPWTLAEILLLVALLALAIFAWLVRGSSRYDVLIAAWAGSILVHVALLLMFGLVPVEGGGTDPGGDDGPEFQLRVSPVIDSGGIARSGARGGAQRPARVEMARSISTEVIEGQTDLTSSIRAPVEAANDPGRQAVLASTGAEQPREFEDRDEVALPSVPTDASTRGELPGLGQASRREQPQGVAIERLSARAHAISVSGANSRPGAALTFDASPGELPQVARAASNPSASSVGPRALAESEIESAPAAMAAAAPRTGELAALAPASAARDRSAPALERFSAERPPRVDELTAPRSSGLDTMPTREVAPPVESPPRIAATPYQTRVGPAKERALEKHGGTAETEAAVAAGLRYLARIQGRLGNWGPLDHRDAKYGEVCVGKTALATLAFLAAGHTHVSATEHSAVVQRALAFLLATQDRASGHFGDTSAYSHGITTFALAEALAITGDASLRESVEQAVKHVLARQARDADPRKRGGWSYYYVDPEREFDPWPRTSITAWQVMALESARLSGVSVPDEAFEEAARFLEASREPRADWYRYSHDPNRLRSGYPTLPASTPAALFALSCIGRDIGGPEHAAARAYVLERAPRGFRFTNERDFVERAQGNPYFWYQATLAMFRVGGSAWRRWNAALQETLLPAQDDDGSWRPIDVYARYARDDEKDRAYTTALCVLCLEVYYRYDLPLLSAALPAAEPR